MDVVPNRPRPTYETECRGTQRAVGMPTPSHVASSLAPASLSSVTNLSWNVPAVRSTLPLACGDRAKTICMPSSSIARLNCVGATGAPGHVLEDGVPVGVEREHFHGQQQREGRTMEHFLGRRASTPPVSGYGSPPLSTRARCHPERSAPTTFLVVPNVAQRSEGPRDAVRRSGPSLTQ